MSALGDKLKTLGFTDDSAGLSSAQSNAQAQGMDATGTYTVQEYLVKDNVIVIVEQNDNVEDLGGYNAVVQHPALAIISSPKGRVAFNPEDLDLATALVTDLS